MIISIIAFIVILLLLVVAHEFGHFILAKKAGVKVYEFAVGMGPKLFSWNKPAKLPRLPKEQQHLIGSARDEALKKAQEKEDQKTEVSLRLLPLGGFVSIKGESPSEQGATEDKNSLLQASFRWKIAILFGGVAMNVLVARVLFTIGFFHGIKPMHVLPENSLSIQSRSYLVPSYSFMKELGLLSGSESAKPAEISDIIPGGLGDKIGLQHGDIIKTVNNVAVSNITLPTVLKTNIGKNITIQYVHSGENKTVQAVCPHDMCVLGVYLPETGIVDVKQIKFSLGSAMKAGAHEIWEQTKLTFVMLGNIITGIGSKGSGDGTMMKLSGPIGAAKFGGVILLQGGRIMFLMFAGLFSMALAIFNILPIPALDGGRALSTIIQKIFRFKPEKYYTIEGWINMVFFIALLLLGVVIMWNDLVRFWGVKLPFIG